jgi:hypothetical protein
METTTGRPKLHNLWMHIAPTVARFLTATKASVKKTFLLNIEGKNRDRVLDTIRHEIRKYVKRQRRIPLPEGVDFWDFDCKFGANAETAVVVHLATISALIDAVAANGGEAFYLEMLAKTGHRTPRNAGVPQSQKAN